MGKEIALTRKSDLFNAKCTFFRTQFSNVSWTTSHYPFVLDEYTRCL